MRRPGLRRLLRGALWATLALVCAALAGAAVYREELTRVMAVNTLFEADRIVGNFSSMDAAFLTHPVPRGDGPVSPLPRGPALALPPDVVTWLDETAATGLVVLDRGMVVHEAAYLGTTPEDRRITWSIAKSFVSVLVGISVDRGELRLDDLVTDHAPALAGGAYDGLRVHDVLTMQSGVTFDEDYLDPRSDINRMGRILALGGSMDGFAAGLTERDGPAGVAWHYVSIDTHVLAMVLRGATGQTIPALLSGRIMAPLGLETAPYILRDGDGVAFALGGLNMTLRDTARFGLMVSRGGRVGATRIVSEAWIDASTAPQARTAEGALRYGYQWWIPWDGRPGETMGRGIYGQYLYIDRAREVVIVVTAADRQFREPGRHGAALDALRALADATVAAR